MSYRYQDFVDELSAGVRPAVFVDDTGSPGTITSANGPHPERQSWVAVILSPEQAAEVFREFPRALSELHRSTGAKEFHFSDVYGGRGDFKGVPVSVRLGIFQFMAHIFQTYNFPLLVQTFDPDTLREIQSAGGFPDRVASFDLRRPRSAALFFLLMRAKWFLQEWEHRTAARIFIDEGFKKNGVALRIPTFATVFADGLVCFANSQSVLPIQLADFAAFSLNRVQILLGRNGLSELDEALLTILSPIATNYRNITHVTAPLNLWTRRGNA